MTDTNTPRYELHLGTEGWVYITDTECNHYVDDVSGSGLLIWVSASDVEADDNDAIAD